MSLFLFANNKKKAAALPLPGIATASKCFTLSIKNFMEKQ